VKFSENWLREWINPPLTTAQLAEQLTMAGLEVAGYEATSTSTLIEVDLTPNRGDCASVRGLAREIAVLNDLAISDIPIAPVVAACEDQYTVVIKAPEDCPRYIGRVIRNIQKTTTPAWMVARLASSDIHAIHPVVDIINYVMLELGQPMHVFDAQKLQKEVVIRTATAGEVITTLDNKTVTLSADVLVIADSQGPQAIAGIIGGLHSAVSDNTTDLFLESALFVPERIAGKARRLGLHTDSSFRFERGVDSALQRQAIERATALIIEHCGGTPGPCVECVREDRLPVRPPIVFRYPRVEKLLGERIEKARVIRILESIGCVIQPQGSDYQVLAPSYRYDLSIEIDLIEEIARVVGYNNIASHLPVSHLQFSCVAPVTTSRIKRALVDMGYQEVITYSFVDDKLQKLLFPELSALMLSNPISENMNVMRNSIWPGLLTTVQYNQRRQQERLKIFEIGLRFVMGQEGELRQEKVIAGLVCGENMPLQWGELRRSVDFFDAKQAVVSLWELNQSVPLVFESFAYAPCHPGQCAQILANGEVLGVIGRLHPAIEKHCGLQGPIYLFEVRYDFFAKGAHVSVQPPSRFPEIRRDLALIVEKDYPSDGLIHCIKHAAGALLREVTIFDVYEGKGVDPMQKSIALGLTIQDLSRTLVDEEINTIIEKVVSSLKEECNATLRE